MKSWIGLPVPGGLDGVGLIFVAPSLSAMPVELGPSHLAQLLGFSEGLSASQI